MYFGGCIKLMCISLGYRRSYAQILLNKISEKIKRLLYIDEQHNNQLHEMNGNIPADLPHFTFSDFQKGEWWLVKRGVIVIKEWV